MNNDVPTTSQAATNIINVIETKAKTRQKLATPPQTDLEVPETPEEDKIVDPANLPNQDPWPFTQQQIADTQKTDPMLDQTHQKVENQRRLVFSFWDISTLLRIFPGVQKRCYDKFGVYIFRVIIRLPSLLSHGTFFVIYKLLTLFDYTTFNCMVSTAYNSIRVLHNTVPEIINQLQESQFCGIKIISIDTKQISGYFRSTRDNATSPGLKGACL
uniref:Uncharacterized protein n=1 Tax=Romanomermis culicivorax TaxID=13658 RepID=A0A915LB01_ROMCU